MTALPDNIEALLEKLTENSRSEMNLIRTLADAIRRVDDQLLREVRSVSIAHEIRREAIVGELQTLANRLCALPARSLDLTAKPSIAHRDPEAPETTVNGNGADWRQATKNIGEEDFDFEIPAPHH